MDINRLILLKVAEKYDALLYVDHDFYVYRPGEVLKMFGAVAGSGTGTGAGAKKMNENALFIHNGCTMGIGSFWLSRITDDSFEK